MTPLKRVALVVVTLVACVGCDQKTKSLARDALRGRETESFLADTFRLDYAENPGGFLECGFRGEGEQDSGLKANSDSGGKANGFRPSPESFSR